MQKDRKEDSQMKITKQQLKQIIKEEIESVLNEDACKSGKKWTVCDHDTGKIIKTAGKYSSKAGAKKRADQMRRAKHAKMQEAQEPESDRLRQEIDDLVSKLPTQDLKDYLTNFLFATSTEQGLDKKDVDARLKAMEFEAEAEKLRGHREAGTTVPGGIVQ